MVYSIIQLQPDSAGDIRLAHFSVFQLLVLVLLFVLSSFCHTALISVSDIRIVSRKVFISRIKF